MADFLPYILLPARPMTTKRPMDTRTRPIPTVTQWFEFAIVLLIVDYIAMYTKCFHIQIHAFQFTHTRQTHSIPPYYILFIVDHLCIHNHIVYLYFFHTIQSTQHQLFIYHTLLSTLCLFTVLHRCINSCGYRVGCVLHAVCNMRPTRYDVAVFVKVIIYSPFQSCLLSRPNLYYTVLWRH